MKKTMETSIYAIYIYIQGIYNVYIRARSEACRALGGFWRLFEALGSWRPLEAPGGSWRPLEAPEGPGGLLCKVLKAWKILAEFPGAPGPKPLTLRMPAEKPQGGLWEGPERPSKKNDLEDGAVRPKVWGTLF